MGDNYNSPLHGIGGDNGSPSHDDNYFVVDSTPVNPRYDRGPPQYQHRQQRRPGFRGHGGHRPPFPHGQSTPYHRNDRNQPYRQQFSPYHRTPRQKNHHHHHRGNFDNNERGFFHPSMLDNPWAELEKKFDKLDGGDPRSSYRPDSSSSSSDSETEK